MLISHTYKLIFIKTKKTAGSSVESLLVDNFFDEEIDMCTGSIIDGTPRVNMPPKSPAEPDGHKPWHLVKNYVTKDQWNEYTKFTIERNPWDKLVSDFFWQKNLHDDKIEWDDDDVYNFEWYVDNFCNKLVVAPSDWNLYADKSGPVVDNVIQYGNLKQELAELLTSNGVPITEDIIESTRKKSGLRKVHYTEMYQNEEYIDKVAKMFSKEIEYFGYKFGE